MIRVTCDQCRLNYCLKHRHPLDHDCKTDGKPLSKSGWVPLNCSSIMLFFHLKSDSVDLWTDFFPLLLLCFLFVFFNCWCLRHAALMRTQGTSSTSASTSSSSSSSSSGNTRPVSNGLNANSRSHSTGWVSEKMGNVCNLRFVFFVFIYAQFCFLALPSEFLLQFQLRMLYHHQHHFRPAWYVYCLHSMMPLI